MLAAVLEKTKFASNERIEGEFWRVCCRVEEGEARSLKLRVEWKRMDGSQW
jgi:hypothetical protein